MARIKRSVLFDAVHGKLGDYVIKHLKSGAVLCRLPQKGPIPPSEKQIAQQERAKRAGEYYWRVKADPALALCYEREAKRRGWPLSAVTLRDYSCPPTVHAIDLTKYNGFVGQSIQVRAFDDTYVKAVELTLRGPAGNVIEEGPAIASETRVGWVYTARCNVPKGIAVTVTAVAVDLPGNRGKKEATWKPVFDATVSSPEPRAVVNTPTMATGLAKLDFDPRAG